jgi:hypothetical protein
MAKQRLNASDKLLKLVRNDVTVSYDHGKQVVFLEFPDGSTLETAAQPESKDINELLSSGLSALIDKL